VPQDLWTNKASNWINSIKTRSHWIFSNWVTKLAELARCSKTRITWTKSWSLVSKAELHQPSSSKAFRTSNSKRATSSEEVDPIKDNSNSRTWHLPSNRTHSSKPCRISMPRLEEAQTIPVLPLSSKHRSKLCSSSNRPARPTWSIPRNSCSLNNKISSNNRISCSEQSMAVHNHNNKTANSISSSCAIYSLQTKRMVAWTSSSWRWIHRAKWCNHKIPWQISNMPLVSHNRLLVRWTLRYKSCSSNSRNNNSKPIWRKTTMVNCSWTFKINFWVRKRKMQTV